MFNALIGKTIEFLADVRQKRAVILLLILLLLLNPLVIYIVFNYRQYNDLSSEWIHGEREEIAFFAGIILEERFNRAVDLGVSLATRVNFRRLIARGRWEEAVAILSDVPADFQFLDRLFLADPEGTLMADLPSLPGVRGRNFAFRDWYQGVSKEWKPYISQVYRRTAVPQYNVVAVAVPIRGDDESVLGILVLQMRLDQLELWARMVKVGDNGFVYFVDQAGHPVAHPDFPSQAEIQDFSDIPEVQRVLRGERGVGLLENPRTGGNWLVAYYTVPRFGWGVVAAQREEDAFVFRERLLYGNIVPGIIFIALSTLFALFIFRLIHELALHRQKQERIFENMGDGVFTIDRNWKINEINEAACKLSGWKREEVLGKPFRDVFTFVRAHDKKENIAFIEEAMLFKKTGFMESNTLLITKSGSELPVSDSAAPLLDENNEVMGAVIIFRDATQEKESAQIKSDFAYASHQLRTPVTQALWSIETALEAKDRDDVGEYLKVARQSMESVVELVTQVVNVSEIDNGRVHPKFVRVRVAEIIKKLEDFLKEKASAHKLEFRIDAPAQDLEIDSDPSLLVKALTEIAGNACTYNRIGGMVSVEIGVDSGKLLIAIHDTGIGISEEQQPLVFTKFFRGSNFKTHEIPGAGLGLYIAREYVKLLGGKVWFRSKEGEKSTFFVALPLEKK